MSENRELRDELFPDGPPSPEEFIQTVAQYIVQQNGSQKEKRGHNMYEESLVSPAATPFEKV